MDRDIKFRGKNIDTNRWVYGGYYKHLKRTPLPISDNINGEDWQPLIITSSFSDWNMPKRLECFEVNENTIGQYTGLKDIDNIDIYEGDIIHEQKHDRVFEVVFKDGMFKVIDKQCPDGMSLITVISSRCRSKIIGNIFEEEDREKSKIEECPCMKEESLNCGMKCSNCGREL